MTSHIDPGNAGGGGVVIPDTWMDVPARIVPQIFTCEFCGDKFIGIENEGLFHQHLYKLHPIKKPVLMIKNEELGSTKKFIYQTLTSNDIELQNCTRITVNGESKTVEEFKTQLVTQEKPFFKIELSNKRFLNSDTYEIEFLVSSSNVLDIIDNLFINHFFKRTLVLEDVAILVDKLKPYTHVETRHYIDSYISYLYGILAKEQTEGMVTTFTQYQDKFKSSIETLKHYQNRKLAGSICAVALFNLNYFDGTEQLADVFPGIFNACRFIKFGESIKFDIEINIPVDWITKKVIELAICERIEDLLEAELLLKSGFISDTDKNKIILILVRKYKRLGYDDKVSHLLRQVKNNPDFEKILNNILDVKNGRHSSDE